MIKSKSGETYIDVSVMVLCAMMLIVLALNTFSFFAVKQDLDHFAKEMIKVATTAGRIESPAIDNRMAELTTETGLNPTVTFDAPIHNSTFSWVQLGNTITVTLTYQTHFRGFGLFNVPITLTARHSGLSQRYWK